MEFKPDELQLLERQSRRCLKCGHMEVFHNKHCCMFCNVENCECEWDADFPEESSADKEPSK